MLHPLSGSITGTGRAGYTALFTFIFPVSVLLYFRWQEQIFITVIFKTLFHNAALHFPVIRHAAISLPLTLQLDVAAFAVCIQSSCHPIVSELTSAVICLVCAWLIASRK